MEGESLDIRTGPALTWDEDNGILRVMELDVFWKMP